MSDDRDEMELEAVYRAPDETTAQLIRGLLESEGIDVMLKSLQVPWYDGVMRMGEGYWGDIMVPHEQAEQARAIIHAYESSE
jgi:hypothetical protein